MGEPGSPAIVEGDPIARSPLVDQQSSSIWNDLPDGIRLGATVVRHRTALVAPSRDDAAHRACAMRSPESVATMQRSVWHDAPVLARDVLLDVLRTIGVRHIFGNPGSTELPLDRRPRRRRRHRLRARAAGGQRGRHGGRLRADHSAGPRS